MTGYLKTFITMTGIVEEPILAVCPGMAVMTPGAVVRLSTDWTALPLLHYPLAVRTVQHRTERLLVAALEVAVITLAEVAPLSIPDLAVTQGRSQIVQGGARLCN